MEHEIGGSDWLLAPLVPGRGRSLLAPGIYLFTPPFVIHVLCETFLRCLF